jgi:hypothetical protein
MFACGSTCNPGWSVIQTPLRTSELPPGVGQSGCVHPVQSPMAAENYQEPAPLFDSLPYYDNDLESHPILREKVQHELAVETQKTQQETLHPRVPPPIELFAVRPSITQSQSS